MKILLAEVPLLRGSKVWKCTLNFTEYTQRLSGWTN